jgi:predicted GNAT family acetyltransferase
VNGSARDGYDSAMATDPPIGAIEVRDNPEEQRFEAHLGDRILGIAEYEPEDDRIIFVHTEVLPDAEGMGVGSALARGALDAARASGRRIVPECPFISSYVRRHHDWDDLIDWPRRAATEG